MGKENGIEEKLQLKKFELDKIEQKLRSLASKRSGLVKEIKLLEMEKKNIEYKELEISLVESGLSLSELIKKIRKEGQTMS